MDALLPGDTLYVVGELTNPLYDPNYTFDGNVSDPHLWHSENTFKINGLEGTADGWITFLPYDETTVLKGDGSNIVRVSDSAYLRFINLTVYGEVLNIPYSTAKAMQFVYKDDNNTIQYRIDPSLNLTDGEINNLTLPIIGSNIVRSSYTDTRGMYMSNCHHILIQGNTIVNIPGNGLRVSDSEYVDIIENEVTNTSRKSYSGTHGLTATYSKDQLPQENENNYRIRILRNIVHHNC